MKPIKLKKSQWWIMTLICLSIIILIILIFFYFGLYEKLKLISLFDCPGIWLCRVPIIKGLSNPLGILAPLVIFIAICYPIFTKIFDISDLE